MRIPRSAAVVVAAIGCCVALSGTAFADATVSSTVGPVTIPSVPVSVRVTAPGVDKVVSTPAAQSVTLKVTATALTPTVAVTPPKITKIACPSGTQGAAVEVASGSAAVTAGGTVTIGLNGTSTTLPVVPAVVTPGKTAKIYACTAVS